MGKEKTHINIVVIGHVDSGEGQLHLYEMLLCESGMFMLCLGLALTHLL